MEPGDDVRRRPRRAAGDGDERLSTTDPTDPRAVPGRLPPFVPAGWLAASPDEVTICDVRWSLGDGPRRDAYVEGHVPGAVFVDLDRDLAAPPGPGVGRHPLPEPEAFAEAMSRLGIGDGSRVVAYDDAGGAVAARLVWMLRALGEEAAVMDGGLAAWPGPLETGEVRPGRATFTPRPWPPDRVADADLVARLGPGGEGAVVDVRDPERYRGEVEPVDPVAGHVPGARNLPWRSALGTDGTLREVSGLRAALREVGLAPADGRGTTVAVHCGSGVNACHTALVAEAVGLAPPRVYVGSWSGWATSDRPVARGAAP